VHNILRFAHANHHELKMEVINVFEINSLENLNFIFNYKWYKCYYFSSFKLLFKNVLHLL